MNKTIKLFVSILLVFLALTHAAESDPKRAEPESSGVSQYDSLSITILYSNNPFDKRLKTSWGFACLIKGIDKTILFDAGADGKILLSNMEKMGINPSDIDIVFLSHTHSDHVGGLWAFLKKNHDVNVYLPAFSGAEISGRIKAFGANVIKVSRPIRITNVAYSTGSMGSGVSEQSLIIRTPEGIVIVTGCAHPGIVEIVKRAIFSFGRNVLLLVGGFHLISKSEKEIYDIARTIKSLGVKYVAPEHCSGDKARKIFKKIYGKNYIESGVGKTIYIHELKQ